MRWWDDASATGGGDAAGCEGSGGEGAWAGSQVVGRCGARAVAVRREWRGAGGERWFLPLASGMASADGRGWWRRPFDGMGGWTDPAITNGDPRKVGASDGVRSAHAAAGGAAGGAVGGQTAFERAQSVWALGLARAVSYTNPLQPCARGNEGTSGYSFLYGSARQSWLCPLSPWAGQGASDIGGFRHRVKFWPAARVTQ